MIKKINFCDLVTKLKAKVYCCHSEFSKQCIIKIKLLSYRDIWKFYFLIMLGRTDLTQFQSIILISIWVASKINSDFSFW